VRDRDGVAVKPETMYQEFVDKLPSIISKEFLDKAIHQSHQSATESQQDASQSAFNFYRLKRRPHRRKDRKHLGSAERTRDSEENNASNLGIFMSDEGVETAFKFNFD
jgi:hypothetical protein